MTPSLDPGTHTLGQSCINHTRSRSCFVSTDNCPPTQKHLASPTTLPGQKPLPASPSWLQSHVTATAPASKIPVSASHPFQSTWEPFWIRPAPVTEDRPSSGIRNTCLQCSSPFPLSKHSLLRGQVMLVTETWALSWMLPALQDPKLTSSSPKLSALDEWCRGFGSQGWSTTDGLNCRRTWFGPCLGLSKHTENNEKPSRRLSKTHDASLTSGNTAVPLSAAPSAWQKHTLCSLKWGVQQLGLQQSKCKATPGPVVIYLTHQNLMLRALCCNEHGLLALSHHHDPCWTSFRSEWPLEEVASKSTPWHNKLSKESYR